MTAPGILVQAPPPKGMQFDSPELELLVRCARTEVDADCAARIRVLLESNLDWSRVMHFALRHRVIPLLHRQLKYVAPEILGQPELASLVARARNIAGRNLQLTQELIRLLGVFQKHGIAAIPIKGPVLAVAAFGNLAARQFEDLDILIQREDILRAREVISSEGYEPEKKLTRPQLTAFLHSEHAFQYRRDGCRFVVELHWRLQDRYLVFPFEQHELWKSTTEHQLMGRHVRSLNTRNLLLYLCMHGAKHYWERLEWIACLPAVIRADPDLDWHAVLEQARRMGGLRILQLGMLLAHDLDGSRYTEAAVNLVQPGPIPRELARRVWRELGANELDDSWREVYRFRFYLNARERLADRVRVVRYASIRIPHPDSSQWERSELPTWLLFVYYFLKPARMLRKYGLQGLRGVFRPTGMLGPRDVKGIR